MTHLVVVDGGHVGEVLSAQVGGVTVAAGHVPSAHCVQRSDGAQELSRQADVDDTDIVAILLRVHGLMTFGRSLTSCSISTATFL